MRVKPSWIGLSALIKETPEGVRRLSAMWAQSEKTAIYELVSGPSPDAESASTLDLDFQASRTAKNKIPFFDWVFINHSVYGILLQQPE